MSVDAVLTPQLRDPTTLTLAPVAQKHTTTTTTVGKKPARNVHSQHPFLLQDFFQKANIVFARYKSRLVPSLGAPAGWVAGWV